MLLHAKAAQLPFSILKWRSISRQPSAPQLLVAPSPTEKFHCSWRAISVILLLISSKIILKKLTHGIKKKKKPSPTLRGEKKHGQFKIDAYIEEESHTIGRSFSRFGPVEDRNF